VSAPIQLPSGQTQFDITGGTRPEGGTNLFHSFGDFNVPNDNIANFLNDSGLPTSNILARVTGGDVSNIFGTIQTTGFGHANLFLMNPAGFLFGPTATVNVGGMVTFNSADYLKLADGVRFNASPSTSADLLLSTAPVAAFGFLGSNPGAITVQGSQLSVTEGTGISLVGGNITVQAGTLTAPSGQINLVSVGKPSNPKVGGEVAVAGSGLGAGFTPTGFHSLGTITLTQGSTLDVSPTASSTHVAASVVIRGGQFVMNDSSIQAVVANDFNFNEPSGTTGGTVELTAEQITLSNHSTIDTSVVGSVFPGIFLPGHITFNVGTFSATDSSILAIGGTFAGGGGAVTIQGLQGSDTFAHAVSLTNTRVDTTSLQCECGPGDGGPILLQADKIALNQSTLTSRGGQLSGGPIKLSSSGDLDIRDSNLVTTSDFGFGGPVDLTAGKSIDLAGTIIDAQTGGLPGGDITLTAPTISLSGSTLDVSTGGIISLTGTKAVSLSNGTVLSADSVFGGGTIQIEGRGQFTSQQSMLSAQGGFGNGGTIQVEAKTVNLTDTQLTTSANFGPQSVGGTITIDAKNTTLTNSQILSTNFGAGPGGTVAITSPIFHQDSTSVIDASSQSGTDGTVTINGIIQP
jgi:filamentous hemagglutinin family protein